LINEVITGKIAVFREKDGEKNGRFWVAGGGRRGKRKRGERKRDEDKRRIRKRGRMVFITN
jgi:hypothetical protein